MGRSAWRPRALRVALPLVLALGGLVVLVEGQGNASRPTLGIVGDSITADSSAEIHAAVDPTYFAGLPRATMARAATAIRDMATLEPQGPPEDWIVELGTDDDGWFENAGQTDPNWAAEFQWEVQYLQSASCVIFVTVSQNPMLPPPIPQELDSAMWTAAFAHPNFHVLDWGDIQYSQPGWVQHDEIHPTAVGSAELADLEAQALQHDC